MTINITFFIDLLPGRMYTVFVSTATTFTDQLPPELFSAISASDQTTTSGSSGVHGGANTRESFSSTEVAVAATIPSLFALFLLIILITVIIVFICKQRSYKQVFNNSSENRTYYSTVGPPLPSTLIVEGNIAYETIHCGPVKSTSSDLSDSQKNVAYGVHIH